MKKNVICLPSLLVLCWTGLVHAQDDIWPEYRGPTGDGWAEFSEPPLIWSETENVRWKTPIHGRGWSTPAVAEGRAWLTTATADGKRISYLCVDLESGEILHDQLLFEIDEPEHRNSLNSYASPSPVIEEGRVWFHFGTYGTACVDTETAEVLWSRRDLHCDHMEGPGSSPFLYQDLLIVHMDGGDIQYVVALDKESGETRWRTERSVDLSGLGADFRKSYGTPILVELEGREQLISQAAQAVYAYDPHSGEELWRFRFKGFSIASRPLLDEDLLFLSTGFMKAQYIAVRLGGEEFEGELDDDRLAWRYTGSVPTMSSGLLVDGKIYLVSDSGMAACLDARSGKRLWRERFGANHCASPIHAAGRIYFFDREGGCKVIAPGPEFEVLAENELDEGMMASPVLIEDALLLRTTTHLYRIEE